MHWDVVVIGAGAAGLLAATRAAENGRRVLLIEKNPRPGVKILMSGGTRCNLTHATDARGIVDAFGRPGRFLHSALAALGPADLVQLVEAEGVATKIEETGKVFPASNRAADVLAALRRRLDRSGAAMIVGDPVLSLDRRADGFALRTASGELTADRIILTTGGLSYPGCGTTGDGFAWATQLGHTIVTPRPALTPLTTSAEWVRELRGLTIPDVDVRVVERAAEGAAEQKLRPLARQRGSFLFTHFGLSGPTVLDVSRAVTSHPRPDSLELRCDFLPSIHADEIGAVFQQASESAGKQQVASLLTTWLPRRLVEALVQQAELTGDRRAAELSRRDRERLIDAVKQLAIPLTGALGYQKAEVTAGGVSLDEVDSRTMQSKLVPGLFFAGEVLDLDGPIGGYNFQAAFSTGWLAGESASK
jgi:predicted Rossmann fold flavoprotein